MSERSNLHMKKDGDTASGEDAAALRSSEGAAEYVGQGAAHTAPIVSYTDVDGDGDVDLTVRLHGESQVRWFENTIGNQADAVYSHEMFRTLVPTAASAADVDGDGRTDLVVGHMSGVTIFLNDELWTAKSLPVSLSSPRAILLKDVDNDGDKDILIRDSRELLMVKNSPEGLGTEFLSWPDLGDSSQLAVGDFDVANQHMEILTLNKEGLLGMVSHNGRHWQPLQQISSLPSNAISITDINLDGYEDIVILTESGQRIWLENKGDGNVELHVDDELAVLNPEYPSEPDEVPGAPESIKVSQPDTMDYIDYSPPPPSLTMRYSPMNFYDLENDEPRVDYNAAPDLTVTTAMDNFGPGSSIIHGWNWTDFTYAGSGNDYIHGHGGCDILFGGSGEDTVIGGSSGDVLFGGSGDDLVAGQSGSDLLFGDGGDDQIYGGTGDDTLLGGTGDDTLYGGDGDDNMMGEDGDDVVFGGLGMDTMTGSEGRDTFIYTSAKEGDDVVYDFTVGEDRFEFQFGSDVLHIVTGQYSGEHESGGEAFIWEQTDDAVGRLYYDADTGSTGNETLIATVYLDEPGELTSEDIDVV